MCIAVPGKVVEVTENKAEVDFGGAKKKLRTDLLEDVQPGDYVLNHVGFAIKKISEEEAKKTLELFEELV